MKPHQPTVSVIIPFYKGVGYLGEALDSVFSQTYHDYEVLIVNDGSPETPALEAALSRYLPRIRYFHRNHGGPAAARNTGIHYAQAEYVAFLDSDDVWLPEFIAGLIGVMERDPGLDLSYADAILVGETPHAGKTLGELLPSPGVMTFASLVRRHCIVHPSCVLARRSALIDAGSFDEGVRYSEDLDLWIRLVHRGVRTAYVPLPLIRRRVHGMSLSGDLAGLVASQLLITSKLLDTLPDLTISEIELLRADASRCAARLRMIDGIGHLIEGRSGEALEAFGEANRVLADWRLSATRMGLLTAPKLARRICMYYLSRHRRLRFAPISEDVASCP